MKIRIRNLLQYILFLGGGLALVWWQLSDMNETERAHFKSALKEVRYIYIVPIVIISILSHLARSLRWRLLMEPLDYKPSVINTFCSTMVGYLANTAVPRLGEIYKCTLLAKYEKLRSDRLIGTIVLERAFDFVCYLIFIGITILIQIEQVSDYASNQLKNAVSSEGMPLAARIAIFIAIVTAIVYFFRWLFKKHGNNKFVLKTRSFVSGIREGLSTIRHLKKRKLFLFYTLLIWVFYLLQVYLGFSALEATEHLSLKAACSVLTLATLAMIATPGGIGTFPFAVMKTLEIYKIPSTAGQAFGWIMWGVSTAIIVVIGLICYLLLPFINRRAEKNIPQKAD